MFIHNEKLKELILIYRESGVIPFDLHVALYSICKGIARKIGEESDAYDGIMAIYQKMIEGGLLQKINIEKNIHSYLSTVVFNGLNDFYRKKKRESSAVGRLFEKVNESSPYRVYAIKRNDKNADE